MWTHITNLKWFGFGFDDSQPGPGSLAIECPACAKKGINTPTDGRTIPHRYGITSYSAMFMNLPLPSWICDRNIVFDGNFKAEHLKSQRTDDDVSLSDGTGFMVTEAEYQKHIVSAVETRQVVITAH